MGQRETKSKTPAHHFGIGGVYRCVVRYPDAFVVPWLLGPADLFAYTIARFVSLTVPLVLSLLEVNVTPQLRSLALAEPRLPFQTAAARVNLGYLMICGAISLVILSILPRAVERFSMVDQSLRDILIWLVLGQAAPALFGATGLLMRVMNRSAFHDVLLGLTACLFWVGAIIFGSHNEVGVAQSLAAAQLAHAAICASLLTQSGVWPGMTALINKQIKLF